MPDIGIPELIIILVVLVLLFGARKLPDLARSIGRSTSEFKRGMREGAADDEQAPSPQPPAQSPAPAQPSAPPPPPSEEAPRDDGPRPAPAG
jgi:sec-independent protein translocase protein TatA